jgi:hypothetical protein
VLVGQDQSGQAGSMLTAAGDVDADGFADLWIGEPYRSFADGSQGAAWLVRGGPGF